jgi:hypothetical protein
MPGRPSQGETDGVTPRPPLVLSRAKEATGPGNWGSIRVSWSNLMQGKISYLLGTQIW